MNSFYERELKILRDAKNEFDGAYKNAEFAFNTEQILMGLAELSSRIRQEAEESENEIARDFAESVAPKMMLPLPARSLVEISPASGDNQERVVPHGALLSSKHAKSSETLERQSEKAFFWSIASEHKLNPLQKIISVKAVEDSGGFDCLEIESKGSGPWIIFINGESEFAWNLWHLMLSHAKPFVIAEPENPWELCRDFFCFEEKFRYIYMENLPQKIRFAKKLPKNIFSKIQTENFKLKVFPVENSFEQNLEPISLEAGAFEAKIFPNEKRQAILHLKNVLAGNIKKANFKEIEYRYNSEKIRFANLPPDSDALSVTAIVCDKLSAANALKEGSVLQVKNLAMQMCEVRSVIDALPFLPFLPNTAQPEWEILGLLQKNYLHFFEEDALKNALLLNAQGKRLYLAQSIKSVSLEHKNAVHKCCLLPLVCVTIILSLEYSPGILHAFGNMLYALFKKIFICNMLVELVLRIEHSGEELKWE